MDSKAINKLIRTEIWPVLRQFGFSHFEPRNAYAYKSRFINVVNFQSFNSYNAGVLGCTSYSFVVNVGTYVIGHPPQRHVKLDGAGRLRPFESQCSFRTVLRKRTSIDGFERDDIFYIDPEGRTTGACFNELHQLVSQMLPRWFEERNRLDELICRMDDHAKLSSALTLGAEGVPGSYNWNMLKTLLLLLQHDEAPSQHAADRALESIDHMIGNILDFSTIQTYRSGEEGCALDVRELWDRFGSYRRIPAWTTSTEIASIESPIWATTTSRNKSNEPPIATRSLSARKALWPELKKAGFSEFTERLAHRVSRDLIEVVEFLPMDPFERKQNSHPDGLFRIGIGVFWPKLSNTRWGRRDRNGKPRPIVNECHVSNWLVPIKSVTVPATTAFGSAEDAATVLAQEGMTWFELFRDDRSATALLERPNWELFWRYPMMRGYGARTSGLRLMCLAYLHTRNGKQHELSQLLEKAADAASGHFREDLIREWIDEVRVRLS